MAPLGAALASDASAVDAAVEVGWTATNARSDHDWRGHHRSHYDWANHATFRHAHSLAIDDRTGGNSGEGEGHGENG
jgi:hypothetical protein